MMPGGGGSECLSGVSMFQYGSDQTLVRPDLQKASIQEWNVGHAQGSLCPAWLLSHQHEE